MTGVLAGCGFLALAVILWVKQDRVADWYFFRGMYPRSDWWDQWARMQARFLPLIAGLIGFLAILTGLGVIE